ncbi:hypothetical protein ABT403_13945 [Streptomyces sp. NPDC000075]|uniref:hypothetical protein n=1 Tax=Streptomyces TaxID=1883 RepID=UPI0031E406CC
MKTLTHRTAPCAELNWRSVLCIAYADGQLKLAKRELHGDFAGTWSTLAVDAAGGSWPSLVYDKDTAHIAYIKDGKLWYGRGVPTV